MTRTVLKSVTLFWLLLGLSGCESTLSDNGAVTIKSASQSADDALATLAVDETNIQDTLMQSPWRRIETDIRAFYENTNLPANRSYTVDLRFGERTVTAIADCKKITAKYRVIDKEIRFSEVSTPSSVDLGSCIESEHADDAVLALFDNDFLVEKITPKSVLLDALDFDIKVRLSR